MSTESATTRPDHVQQTHSAWDGVAAGFDEFITPQSMALAHEALQRVRLRSGMRFLDVAAGSGALCMSAARLGAHVLATDISPAMIEHLQRRAVAEGLGDLDARVMDGQALELEDDAFDLVGSQNGVTVFPNLTRGIEEMVRVTKLGGEVLIIGFGSLRKAEFLGFFMAALKATVPGFRGLPTDPPPLPFQVADPEKLRIEMASAGLTDVRVDTTVWRMEFRSASHLWDTVISSHPIGAALVADLSHEQKTETQQVLDRMLRERSGGGSHAVLTSDVNIGVGVK